MSTESYLRLEEALADAANAAIEVFTDRQNEYAFCRKLIDRATLANTVWTLSRLVRVANDMQREGYSYEQRETLKDAVVAFKDAANRLEVILNREEALHA
jgi:hypothetical protein